MRNTRRTRNRGAHINDGKRKHTKVRSTSDIEVVDVITSLQSKKNRKSVRSASTRVDNKPTIKTTVRLSASQMKGLDEVPKITMALPNRYSFLGNKLVSEFKHNASFRDAIMSGAYFYYNGKLCLYRSDSLNFQGARVEYADSVKEHPEMYLLSSARRVPAIRRKMYLKSHKDLKSGKSVVRSKSAHGYQSKIDKGNAPKLEVVACHASGYSREANKAETILSQAIEATVSKVIEFVNGGGEGPQDSFGAFFTWLMDEKYKVSKKELSDVTGIDSRTITRMRTESEYKPSLEYIVACCVALGLLPWECDTLLYLAGYTLRLGNKAERAYITIIHVFAVDCSLIECDEILDQMGVTKLSDVISKNKKEK